MTASHAQTVAPAETPNLAAPNAPDPIMDEVRIGSTIAAVLGACLIVVVMV